MSQRKGIYRILTIPILYNFIQWLFRDEKRDLRWNKLIEENQDGVVLDIGCGPGNQSIRFKNSKRYIGLDISKVYINKARQLYGSFGDFYNMSAIDIDKLPYSEFDLVILHNVFHHLSDQEVNKVLEKVSKTLSQKGLVISSDPTFLRGRFFANLIVSLDRGMHVRKSRDLMSITKKYLKTLDFDVLQQNFPPCQTLIMKMGN